MSTPKKILIIHDRFQFRGGAERLVLILAKALDADIMTEFWVEKETYPKTDVPNRLFVLDKGEAPWIVWRYFRAHINFLFKTRRIIRQYDTIIFSGNNCLTASFNCRKGTRKILYCHSPIRHVFDLWKLCRDEQTKRWKKIIYYDIGAWGIRFIYWLGLKQIQTVIANSENTRTRLKNFINQKTDYVVYPPIDTNKFDPARHSLRRQALAGGCIGQGDYYLSFGRLERLKRIPHIVQAFQQMPDKKLVVISGGPDLEKIKDMAKNYPNIQVMGWATDEELKQYVGNCIASIYIPIDEDAGMTQLESMSAGKPCICVHEGGLIESVIDEKTGKFIPAKYTTQDLINAVNWMTPAKALVMKEDCIQQAEKFSQEKFVEKMKDIVFKHKTIIGIDASRSIDNIQKTGVELVSDELLKNITNYQLPITDYQLIYYTPKLISSLPKDQQKILKWPFKYLWTQIRLAWELIIHPPDKLFVPVHKIPFVLYLIPNTIYFYTLIHDIAFKINPPDYNFWQKLYLNFDLKRCIKKCTKIFVPTQQVKDDLLKYTKVDENKIVVIHHGYSRTQNTGNRTQERKKQILYIGRVEEKKNIGNLVEAFKIFHQKNPDYELILAGKPGFGFQKSWCKVRGVKCLGHISDEKKHELLNESLCLVLVSKQEGFGFPVLEGFDFGLPVLASDIAVLKEVGGEACFYAKPHNPQDIADALEKIISDEKLKQKLIKAGQERLKLFSWQKAAETYLTKITE